MACDVGRAGGGGAVLNARKCVLPTSLLANRNRFWLARQRHVEVDRGRCWREIGERRRRLETPSGAVQC